MKYDGPSATPHHSGVAVGVIVFKAGKILMAKRKTPVGDGMWAIPGGRVEYMEDPADAARREVFEEVGLVVGKVELVGYTNDTHYDHNLHYVTLRFVSKDFTGKPINKEPDKCTEIGWFDFNDLPHPMFEPSLQVLSRDDIKQKLRKMSK